MGSATPGQVVLGRKRIEETVGGKPVSRVPPQSLLKFPPWLPSMVKCEPNELFPPQIAFDYGLYHSNRKQTNTPSLAMDTLCDAVDSSVPLEQELHRVKSTHGVLLSSSKPATRYIFQNCD